MKELKFRIWDKKEKTFIHVFDSEKMLIFASNMGDCVNKIQASEEDRLEFLLFTGLLDINGKEIYEGDIVKFHYPAGEIISCVKFCADNGYPAFDLRPSFLNPDFNVLQYAVEQDAIEVIGNIYENPELLKEEEPESNDDNEVPF